MSRAIKLLYGNVADVSNPLSSSGSAYPAYKALEKQFDVIGALNASFTSKQKLFNTLQNFHPDFQRWKERRHKSMKTMRFQTRIAEERAQRFAGQYDFYLQQRALFEVAPWVTAPYAINTDCTHANTVAGWGPWSPFSERELAWWMETEKEIYNRAALLFPRSQFAARSMMEDYGQPKEKITVVGGGINFSQPPPEHGVYDGKTLLFIGYDFERKGGPNIIRAFGELRKAIPDARLLIAGTKQIDTKGIDGISILGPIHNRDQIIELYQQASVFVMPSIYEPWGNVYLEAMAHSVPCIASNWAAAPEIIAHEKDGLLVERNDHIELSEAMRKLLSDQDRLEIYGRRAREKVLSEFTWEKVIERMAVPIRSLLEKPEPVETAEERELAHA